MPHNSGSTAADALLDKFRLPPGPPVRCDGCNKFTKRDEAIRVAGEIGDYGHVYYYVVVCRREGCPGA